MTRTGADGTESSENDLVSVIIPTYHRNERLRETIQSVLDQHYRPVETIIVDGSGTGHARPVVTDFDVEYVAQSADEGPQSARSEGAERASGAYVQFLDDDDRLLPDKLDKQAAYLRQHPDVGVVYCGWQTESGSARLPSPFFAGDVLEPALRLRGSTCLTSTMLLRADVLDAILPLGNRHGADDVGMKIELAQRTQFGYVDEPLLVRGNPEGNLGHSWSAIEGRREILDHYGNLYDQYPPAVRRAALANIYRHAGWTILSESVWSPRAIRYFATAAVLSPEVRPKLLGEVVSSLGGRPGLQAANRLWYTVADRL